MRIILRQTGLALAAILAASLTAQAAELPVKAPVHKVPVSDWTGLYLGVHLGAGWGWKDWTDVAGFSSTVDVDGLLGGFQAGFNYQVNGIVIGIEGDWSWSGIKGSEAGGVAICTAAIPCDADVKWLATLAGRLGFTWGPGLIYVKGGAAWARDQYEFVNAALTASQTRAGWTAGLGLEYLLGRSWSAKIEYNYLDLGTDVLSFNPGPVLIDIDQQLHAVKLGINYRFDWGGPVVARY